MANDKNILQELTDDTKEYIKLEIDDLKLNAVEKLAIVSSSIFAWSLILCTMIVALGIFSVLGVVLLVNLTVSLPLALAIVGASLLLIALLLLINRRNFMINTMVRHYSKLIFSNDEKRTE